MTARFRAILDAKGTTRIAYYSPDTITDRHHLPPETTAALAAIHALTDALVAT